MNSKKILNLLVTFVLLLLLYACNNVQKPNSAKHIPFNFGDTISLDKMNVLQTSDSNTLRIAVSAISSPRETFAYYKELFNYIEIQIGKKIEMVQRKTYQEINLLVKKNEVDLAFVCSGGYVYGVADSSFNLLAVPLQNGSKKYRTYIIASKNSNIKKFEDLEGKTFAFTDSLSTSGFLYPNKRLKEMNTSYNQFFSGTTFTYAHDNSIQLVAKQMVDGAAVNSLVFDFLSSSAPERTKNVKIIEQSGFYGMPPVVISNGVSKAMRQKLLSIFLNAHNDSGSRKVLEKLKVDRYVIDSDTIYKSVRDLAKLSSLK
jgi:phosphonate transport system substrate-binding protein